MADLAGYGGILAGLNWLYWIVAIGATAWAGRATKSWISAGLVAVLFLVPTVVRISEVTRYQSKVSKAQALFDERCKTAGERVYRKVENVVKIELVDPRPKKIPEAEMADQNWVGAGLPKEATGNEYIMSFLYYDVAAEDKSVRFLDPGGTPGPYGSIVAGSKPRGTKGYESVDVMQDGSRFNFSLRPLSSYISRGDPVEAYASRSLSTEESPRYSVIYENLEDPEGRSNWIAGARIKVIDRHSGELLGERVQFSFEKGFGSTSGHRQPWAFAQQCPPENPSTTTTGTVRFFVDKVLRPTQRDK